MKTRTFITIAIAVILAAIIFFNFENTMAWMAENVPFQPQWVSVQLSDAEVLYGHLAGVSGDTISLTDVYLLNTVTETTSTIASSTDISLSAAPGTPPVQTLVPVNYTNKLFVNRAAVLYFKFVTAGDPALPYLH
jgi:hypothetical protein